MNKTVQEVPLQHGSKAEGGKAGSGQSGRGRRIQVRKSGVHGKGVFALQAIAAGERIIEYTGQVIAWPEALRRHPHDPADPNHTFYFSLGEEHVIAQTPASTVCR